MKKIIFLFLFIQLHVFGQDFVQNEVLVQLNPKSNSADFFRTFENKYNLTILQSENISEPMNIYSVKFEQITDHNNLLKLFKLENQVINVQLNHFVTERETIPNDTEFSTQQWHLKNTGQTGGTVDADIDATDAWDISTSGTTTHNDTIVVCILEGSGVDITHIDIKDNIWKNYAEIPNNGIDDDNNGYTDDYLGWNVVSNDDAVGSGSHGTRVAGMIGAKGNNNLGISGVSQNVKMMIVKGQSASNEASVIAAYTYPLEMRKLYNQSNGQSGVFVVATNASWGINNGDPADSPLWCAMYDSLGQVGIINLGATSNSNVNVDIEGDLPTTCPSDYLIGITMTASNDVRADSGYGPINIDLAAPGQGVYLTLPGDIYGGTSGTSFATPCVSGAVALLYSTPCADFINWTKAYPDSAALKVRDLILTQVDPITSLLAEVGSGGRLNINNSMLELLNTCNTNSCIAPYNLTYSNLTDSVVNITWSGFSTDYLFYIQEGIQPMIELNATGLNTIQIDTLTPCTNYTVYVKAICGAQESILSYPIYFRTDGCCENPILSSVNPQNQALEISWQNVLYATDYTLRYRELGTTNWNEVLNATSNTIYTPLLECTEYEFQIKTTCTDSSRGFSPSFIFKTKGCGACYDLTYCDVNGTSSTTEWIDTVKVGNKTIGTGNNGGWLVYENSDFSLLPNSTEFITIIPGYSGSFFTENYSVWIDFDQNGIFDESDKVINLLTNNGPVTGLMTIPSTALTGITKMRIGMIASVSGNPVECPINTAYGEYEDYCVYIGPDASIAENNQSEISIYPNPTTSILNIATQQNILQITIQTIDGKIVKSMTYTKNNIDVSDLPNGIYLIEIKTNTSTATLKFIKA